MTAGETQVFRSKVGTVLGFTLICAYAVVAGFQSWLSGNGFAMFVFLLGLVGLIWVLSHRTLSALEISADGVRDRLLFMRRIRWGEVKRVRLKRRLGMLVLEIAVPRTVDCGLTFLGWAFSRFDQNIPEPADAELFTYHVTFFRGGGADVIAAIKQFKRVEGPIT